MDVMELRRRLMGLMASGARYVSGTFTVPDDSATSYTINFGNTFDKYMIFVEMAAYSKSTLIDAAYESDKIYALTGIYPYPQINNNAPPVSVLTTKFKGSTNSCVNSAPTGFVLSATGSTMEFAARAVTYGNNYLYRGYTYNYYIVEIK